MFSKARSSQGVNKYQEGVCMTCMGCGMCLSPCLDCLQNHLAPASHRVVKLNHSWGNVQYFICTKKGQEEGKDQPVTRKQMAREPMRSWRKGRAKGPANPPWEGSSNCWSLLSIRRKLYSLPPTSTQWHLSS